MPDATIPLRTIIGRTGIDGKWSLAGKKTVARSGIDRRLQVIGELLFLRRPNQKGLIIDLWSQWFDIDVIITNMCVQNYCIRYQLNEFIQLVYIFTGGALLPSWTGIAKGKVKWNRA